MREKHVDVMLFWGILFIVMGHNYQPYWFFFPSYCFAVAFFFFISGYLFKIKQTIQEKKTFLIKKIKKQLLPYFFINLCFGLVTFYLWKKGIDVGGRLNFHNLLIRPFIDGSQYRLGIPMWFYLNLFLVNFIAQLINWKNSRKGKIIVFLILLPIALFLVFKGLNHYLDYRLAIVRTGYALLYFHIGILFREFRKTILKTLKNPLIVLTLGIAVLFLRHFFGKIDYSILYGSVENKLFIVPLITTFFIICISYSVCYYLNMVITEKSWLLKIGQKSFYIMAFHLSIFFVINYFFYLAGRVTLTDLSNVFFSYNRPYWFPVYQMLAIVLPVLLGFGIDRIKLSAKIY